MEIAVMIALLLSLAIGAGAYLGHWLQLRSLETPAAAAASLVP